MFFTFFTLRLDYSFFVRPGEGGGINISFRGPRSHQLVVHVNGSAYKSCREEEECAVFRDCAVCLVCFRDCAVCLVCFRDCALCLVCFRDCALCLVCFRDSPAALRVERVEVVLDPGFVD